jgi:glycogen debranching enzyme
VLASSALADDRTRVLKAGPTFAVFDRHGDLSPLRRGELGLYHCDTRFLSRLELRVGGQRPLLLHSAVAPDNATTAIDLANAALALPEGGWLPQDVIHLFRTAVLGEGVCLQRIRVRSYAEVPLRIAVGVAFAADFADLFEVRGMARARRGELRVPEIGADEVVLGYHGLDGVARRTLLRFEPRPAHLGGDEAGFDLALAPGELATITLSVRCESDSQRLVAPSWAVAKAHARAALARRGGPCRIETENGVLADWLRRSDADLRMMLTDTPLGPFPYAGVPWFSAPFGRDAIVTALETLWLDPAIAVATLRNLAAWQATGDDPAADAEPGKILHERRGGEMAALGEHPFGCYYGSVDSTPLFVLLAHACFERTGDEKLLDELWPAVLRALAWIDGRTAQDRDGFLAYARRGPAGLVNQGWKDSRDSVSHADGRLAEGPIALCEVQAYVYGARCGAAALAEALGEHELARAWRGAAEALRARFEERFWLPALGSYALALDGEGRPCAVRSSNAGHCLLTGLAAPERAARVAETLLAPESFSGWGVRTLAEGERRYNPMSYHNGSVWPHDTALIAAGLARYGMAEPALRLLEGLCEASRFVEGHRLPELVCGFPRRAGEGPTQYPVACAPQAWAAGAVFLLLQACLGLEVSARARRVTLRGPALPPFLDGLRIRDLQVGKASVDLALRRSAGGIGVEVLRRCGDVEVAAPG